MRRTVAMVIFVLSPLLLAAPVWAAWDRSTAPGTPPGRAVAPAAPRPALALTPGDPAPVPVVAVALPAPAAAAPGAQELPPLDRAATETVESAEQAADLSDAAYAARLQADLCVARQIFCGLDSSGRYPGN